MINVVVLLIFSMAFPEGIVVLIMQLKRLAFGCATEFFDDFAKVVIAAEEYADCLTHNAYADYESRCVVQLMLDLARSTERYNKGQEVVQYG